MQESLIPQEKKSLKAEVRNVVFSNADNGWTVAKVKAAEEPGLVTVVGLLGELTPGEMLELVGDWKEHARFGRQFEAASCRKAYPATENGIVRYLGSGLVKGVGPALAKRLVDAFGAEILEILDHDPDRLLAVEGIGRKKLASILESWRAQGDIRTLMLFLQSHEVPTTYAARIFKLYGAGAIEKLKENPYDLAYVIRGIGFRTADRMALKLGFAPDSRERIEAAIIYSLFNVSERGHLFLPASELFTSVADMLRGSCGQESAEPVGILDEPGFDEALASLEELKRVRVEDLPEQNIPRAVYLSHFYRCERETAERLCSLAGHPAPSTTMDKVRKLLPELEREAKMELSPEQREAVLGACRHKVFIITGGPGTGKTTITRTIVRALNAAGLKLKLAAPTGRAAKRMAEATGHPAATLHRLLQYTPEGGFLHGEDNKIKCEAVIVDEASMLDAQLFLSLLRALPLTSRLVLVGDKNQLPSVGPGNVLADLIQSGAVETAILTRIYRQAQKSGIVMNAHRVNEGKFPEEDPQVSPPEKDFWWIVQDDPAKVRELIVQSVCERIPAVYGLDPMRDVQVLTPMHKGEAGTQALNAALQERINPLGPSGRDLSRGYMRFRTGDRVLQLRNNYEKDVYNGDLGWISGIDHESGEVAVDFEGRSVAYDSSELDELTTAYAISIHKSQGSEYPAVVVPLLTQHYVLLQRNLLYTALTRAKKLAILIGSRRAVGIALGNNKADKRYTHLRYRLCGLLND